MKSIIKRVAVGVIGGVVTVVGVVALVAPGPGWLIIFAGLGILATEFAWAAVVLEKAKKSATQVAQKARLQKDRSYIYLAVFFTFTLIVLIIWYTYIR